MTKQVTLERNVFTDVRFLSCLRSLSKLFGSFTVLIILIGLVKSKSLFAKDLQTDPTHLGQEQTSERIQEKIQEKIKAQLAKNHDSKQADYIYRVVVVDGVTGEDLVKYANKAIQTDEE